MKPNEKNLCVIGGGHVGLVVATGFAELGHRVTCVDLDQKKTSALSQGQMTLFEPGLQDLVLKNLAAQRLSFTNSYCQGLRKAISSLLRWTRQRARMAALT